MNTDNSTVAEKRKFTDKQLRILQVLFGLLSAAALVAAIYLPRVFDVPEGDILNYVFVAVFLVVMLGRRSIENRYRLRLGLFSLSLMVGVLAGIIFFVISMLNTLNWSVQAEIMVIAALVLLLLAAIIVPAIRYFKRKEKGTLQPIRLPEPKEPEEKKSEVADETEDDDAYDGPMTIEQQIAAMTRELDEKKQNDHQKEE